MTTHDTPNTPVSYYEFNREIIDRDGGHILQVVSDRPEFGKFVADAINEHAKRVALKRAQWGQPNEEPELDDDQG